MENDVYEVWRDDISEWEDPIREPMKMPFVVDLEFEDDILQAEAGLLFEDEMNSENEYDDEVIENAAAARQRFHRLYDFMEDFAQNTSQIIDPTL
ncbi:unnamed protein product [Cuscuta epithymum]|uniref:Uncharacterized protein n=1 Tax=Cuscuta epithymum TaxID=186058 RepID=A0AAV0DA53_9ASTE|nr:unnamed protein product [Cuscuta epithymum]